jgi:hypothetical protein
LSDIVLHVEPGWDGEAIPFDDPDYVTVDPTGRTYVEDYWGNGVHVFDADGSKSAFLPARASVDWQRDKGGVPDAVGQHPFPAGPEWLVQSWLGPARDDLQWQHDQSRVLLVDSEGHVVRALGTPMNRVSARWARWTNQAPDGSFACLSSMADRRTPPLARIFEANGDLIGMFSLPMHRLPWGLAWSGSRLVLAMDCQVLVLDAEGHLVVDQDLDARNSEEPRPSDRSWTWVVDFGPDGNELWLRRGKRATIISRYRLPLGSRTAR